MRSNENSELLAFKSPASTDWRPLVAETQADEGLKSIAKEARDDLRELLLSSLQMQHIVVLAGSGVSCCVGGPSMQDLWDITIGKDPNNDMKYISEEIHFDLNNQNIEAFLSQAEAYLMINNEETVSKFINSCKKAILERCINFLTSEKLTAHQIFLHRLSRRRARDARLKIFTTNYDLCFERAASELGIVAIDGFSFMAPRHYDPRYFSYDIIRRPHSGEDSGDFLEGVFILYKLHGSVNWARLDNGAVLEKANPTPEDACLIYPANGKYQQCFLQPYLESTSQYLSALREPNTCLFVTGFGFNDNHLSEPLLTAVRSNPHLRLIVADPNVIANYEDEKTNWHWKRLFDLSERGEDIWFVNTTFSEFAKMVPDLKALTPADKLMKAIQGVTRNQ